MLISIIIYIHTILNWIIINTINCLIIHFNIVWILIKNRYSINYFTITCPTIFIINIISFNIICPISIKNMNFIFYFTFIYLYCNSCNLLFITSSKITITLLLWYLILYSFNFIKNINIKIYFWFWIYLFIR